MKVIRTLSFIKISQQESIPVDQYYKEEINRQLALNLDSRVFSSVNEIFQIINSILQSNGLYINLNVSYPLNPGQQQTLNLPMYKSDGDQGTDAQAFGSQLSVTISLAQGGYNVRAFMS